MSLLGLHRISNAMVISYLGVEEALEMEIIFNKQLICTLANRFFFLIPLL